MIKINLSLNDDFRLLPVTAGHSLNIKINLSLNDTSSVTGTALVENQQ
jgi:hypothetical protein